MLAFSIVGSLFGWFGCYGAYLEACYFLSLGFSYCSLGLYFVNFAGCVCVEVCCAGMMVDVTFCFIFA